MKSKWCKVFPLAVLVLLPVPGWAASWEDARPKEAKAFRAGNLEEVKRIVERYGEPFRGGDLTTALDFAASSGNVEVMKYLKSRGWLERCRKRQQDDCFLLHAAANEGAGTNMLGFLIAEGFPVDRRGPLLMTPMFMAAANGHLEEVKYLCEAGADPNAKNQRGTGAVQRAKTRLGAVSLHPDPKRDARIRAGIKSVIQYLETGQCKKK